MGIWTPGPGATSGNDTYTGDGADEFIDGLAGDDTLSGGGGADILRGGLGVDVLTGGTGADTFRLNTPTNFTPPPTPGGSNSTLSSMDTITDFFTADGDLLDVFSYVIDGPGGLGETSSGGLRIFRGDLALWKGEEDNDRLFGGAGADLLFGQAGNDELQGEEDNDTLFGGAGIDTLAGGAGDDTLRGEADADTLSGGAGIDRLIGGGGNDTLNGGADGDFFVFAAGSGADTANGFQDGVDTLDLRTYAGATFANTTVAQQGAHVLVTFVGGESVLLSTFDVANVTAADFLFGP